MPVPPRTLALATGALCAPLLVLGPAAHAAGEATPPPAQPTTDFCADASGGQQFTDIDGNTFEDSIECVAAAEIALGGPNGMPANRYAPGLVVQRANMASFLVRLMDTADELDEAGTIRALPPFDGTVSFTDVPASSTHAQAIDRLAAAGIVRGGAGNRPANQYAPAEPVTRAQMASLVVASLEYLTGDAFSTPDDYFTDDENAVPHEPRINALAAEGIGVGNGPDSFSPLAGVRRDQMSGFLARTLAVLEADGDIAPLS